MTQDEMVEVVVETKTLVQTLHDRLLGNGQPGEIAVMKSDIKSLQKDRDTVGGAIKTIKWIIGALGITELGHIFWRH